MGNLVAGSGGLALGTLVIARADNGHDCSWLFASAGVGVLLGVLFHAGPASGGVNRPRHQGAVLAADDGAPGTAGSGDGAFVFFDLGSDRAEASECPAELGDVRQLVGVAVHIGGAAQNPGVDDVLEVRLGSVRRDQG